MKTQTKDEDETKRTKKKKKKNDRPCEGMSRCIRACHFMGRERRHGRPVILVVVPACLHMDERVDASGRRHGLFAWMPFCLQDIPVYNDR